MPTRLKTFSGSLKHIFCRYICVLPLRWVENPPYNQAAGLAVGWEAHPTAVLIFQAA
ncbi:MAG: hypothetical protein IKX14_06255 [Neisseriaceae bacterium]|nr:hypothetical protein [Neisseriaceae bacterium]